MSPRYRTAFAVPSGFAATTAVEPKPAGTAGAKVDRKAPQPGRPGRPLRDGRIEPRKPVAAA